MADCTKTSLCWNSKNLFSLGKGHKWKKQKFAPNKNYPLYSSLYKYACACLVASLNDPCSIYIAILITLYVYNCRIVVYINICIRLPFLQTRKVDAMRRAFVSIIKTAIADHISLVLPEVSNENFTYSRLVSEQNFFSCRNSSTDAHFRYKIVIPK